MNLVLQKVNDVLPSGNRQILRLNTSEFIKCDSHNHFSKSLLNILLLLICIYCLSDIPWSRWLYELSLVLNVLFGKIAKYGNNFLS